MKFSGTLRKRTCFTVVNIEAVRYAYFLGIRNQEREAGHSPSNTGVKTGGAVSLFSHISSWRDT
jgi:hypothetical protein